jgi:hypothetical protein
MAASLTYKILIPISKPSQVSPESLHSPVALYVPSQSIVEWSVRICINMLRPLFNVTSMLASLTFNLAPTNLFSGRILPTS